MKAAKEDQNIDKGLFFLGCIIYLVVFIFWITEKADNMFAFFGGISALLTIFSSYEVRSKTTEEE